jgi:chromosome segregation ATPase
MDEEHGQPTVSSDTVVHSPTFSEHVPPRPTTADFRTDKHALTTKDVQVLFDRAGLPRNQRSIERYCKSGKLDAFYEPDEQRYFVTQESAERLISQLKEIQTRIQQSAHAVSNEKPLADHDRQRPTMSAYDDRAVKNEDSRIRELENQIRDLQITNKAKDMFIDRLQNERDSFLSELMDRSERIGRLETQLLQLQASRRTQEAIEDAQTSDMPAYAPSVASYKGNDGGVGI